MNNNLDVNWINQKDVIEKTDVKVRHDAIAKSLDLSTEQIVEKLTYLDYDKAKQLIDLIQYYVGDKLNGTGIELGAGSGIFSSVLISAGLERIYALEIVPGLTKHVIPKVAKYYLKNNSDKVIPVLGTFDQINLPDNSLDFAFEYDAFHHSKNLTITYKEIFKKLKPKGILVMIDRCHQIQ